VRLFFASDIHGSTTCFRKLVNAAACYRVDHLLMGGDLAGKELVPIVAEGSGWRAPFRGTRSELETAVEATEFERRVATVGAYTLRTDEENGLVGSGLRKPTPSEVPEASALAVVFSR
jgi:Icc-related predicted phosphoesterase